MHHWMATLLVGWDGVSTTCVVRNHANVVLSLKSLCSGTAISIATFHLDLSCHSSWSSTLYLSFCLSLSSDSVSYEVDHHRKHSTTPWPPTPRRLPSSGCAALSSHEVRHAGDLSWPLHVLVWVSYAVHSFMNLVKHWELRLLFPVITDVRLLFEGESVIFIQIKQQSICRW